MQSSARAAKMLVARFFPRSPNDKPPLLQKNHEQINSRRRQGELCATRHLSARGNQRSRVQNSKADSRWASRSMRDPLELRALLFQWDVVFPEPASTGHLLALLVRVRLLAIVSAHDNQN